MNAVPWSDNKNARQVYREWVDIWNATWEGDTSDGHHVFSFPNGHHTTIAHSPSAGHSWVKARREEAAKITGRPFRGKRNTIAAKQRAAKLSAEQRRARVNAIQGRAQRQRAWEAHQRISENTAIIASIRATLRELRTVEQRRYAEQAIRRLAIENAQLQQALAG